MARRSTVLIGSKQARDMVSFEHRLDLAMRDETTMEDDCTFSQHMLQVVAEVRRAGEKLKMRDAVGDCVNSIAEELMAASLLEENEWPFMEVLVNAACRHVEASYAWIDRDLEIAVDLAIHENAKQRVAASTRFPSDDAAGNRHAMVVLQLPERFDRRDYFSLLSMLHHEIFVHVVQTPDAAGPREAVGDKCLLAEGMLDTVAYRLFMNDIADHLGSGLEHFLQDFRNRASRSLL